MRIPDKKIPPGNTRQLRGHDHAFRIIRAEPIHDRPEFQHNVARRRLYASSHSGGCRKARFG